jgi:probable HAF family extracellular repeat protein
LCVDALGRAAGYSAVPVSPIGSRLRATAWLSGSAPTDLGAPAKSSSSASGINTVNGVLQVVGYVDNNGQYAFLWKNGVMKDLNSLISASGINLQAANAINAHGQIVGYTRVSFGKQGVEMHAFVLTPK